MTVKKRIMAAFLAATLCLSFSGCGGSPIKEVLQSSSEKTSDKTSALDDLASAISDLDDVTADITGEDYDNMMEGLNMLVGEDDRLGKEYYKFPTVTTYSELPDASVWKKMGMIDLTPEEYGKGYVYDDGTTILEGMWNGFAIQCDNTSEETYNKLIQELWDEGYRGLPVGNGSIAEADGFEEVYDDFTCTYMALYEHDGWLLAVQATYYGGWEDESAGSIIAGVYDAKTMINDYPDLRVWPKIDWSVTKEAVPSDLNLKQLGSELHGNWGEYEVKDYYDTYTHESYEIYAYNVKKSEFENYLKDIESQGYSPDLYDEGESWQGWYVIYGDYYNNFYGFYLYYNEKAGEVCWVWDS